MALLENTIILEEGVPRRLHVYDHAIVDREWIDPLLGRPKVGRALMLFIDQVDGVARSSTLSILSEDLANQIRPMLDGKDYKNSILTITKRGSGFLTKYSLERQPL